MKKSIILTLIAGVLFSAFQLNAQSNPKFGHVNSQEILFSMPETKKMQTEIETKGKALEQQITKMYEEYYKKMTELQEGGGDMMPTIREAKIEELANLETLISKTEQGAQNELLKLEENLSAPILEKAQKTIDEVAKDKGYTYIFDTSTGAIVVYPQGDDITPLVKAKMGIN